MSFSYKEYRLFGVLLWSVYHRPNHDELVEDDEFPGDHQGGQFEFGFRDDRTIRLDPGLPEPPDS